MIIDVWKSLAIVVLVSSLALVGCDKKKEAATPTEQAPVATASAPSVNLQDGEWAITSRVEMSGMPAAAMKPYTVKTCLTKENYVPEASQEQSDCKIEDQKIDGNSVSWKMVCKETTGKGTVTYSGDSMEGFMESSTKVGGREIVTKIAMSGKRIGPCPEK
jgi:hypothetical protein